MRQYNSSQKYKSSFGLIDLLFNLLVGFVFLFIIAFILIHPISKKKVLDPKAEFLIIMTWPDGDTNDIDMWIKHDKSPIVSFRAKDNGVMHLDRDDLGGSNDTIIIDHNQVTNPVNREVLSIRQKIEGHYIVNIHWYSKKGDNPLNEVPVQMELLKVNPYKILSKVTVTLVEKGAEMTAIQFDMDRFGFINDITTDQDLWIMTHISETAASRAAFEDGTEDQSGGF